MENVKVGDYIVITDIGNDIYIFSDEQRAVWKWNDKPVTGKKFLVTEVDNGQPDDDLSIRLEGVFRGPTKYYWWLHSSLGWVWKVVPKVEFSLPDDLFEVT